MAPKLRFTHEEVADPAFRLPKEKSFPFVTARAIAAMLGASTMPIRSAIGSRADLVNEVPRRDPAFLEEIEGKGDTDNPYLNKAFSYISYSRNEKNLFRLLSSDAPVPVEGREAPAPPDITDPRIRSPWFGRIDEAVLGAIVFKSYFFIHGLAMALAPGTVRDLEDDTILRLLQEAGGAEHPGPGHPSEAGHPRRRSRPERIARTRRRDAARDA